MANQSMDGKLTVALEVNWPCCPIFVIMVVQRLVTPAVVVV